MIGYHFTADTLRNGSPIPGIGEWLEHDGPIVPCVQGLHASAHPFDALQYAPGPLLHLVELEGDLVADGDPVVDKWVGRRRKILATLDATDLLRAFARWCALQVIDRWDAPAVVRQYLLTGDEALQAAAVSVAHRPITDDASYEAWAAAASAAAAYCTSPRRADASDAAWGVARSSARAAGISAMAAARDAQRRQFLAMVEAAFKRDRDGEASHG